MQYIANVEAHEAEKHGFAAKLKSALAEATRSLESREKDNEELVARIADVEPSHKSRGAVAAVRVRTRVWTTRSSGWSR